jgi:hypothetical protein
MNKRHYFHKLLIQNDDILNYYFNRNTTTVSQKDKNRAYAAIFLSEYTTAAKNGISNFCIIF